MKTCRALLMTTLAAMLLGTASASANLVANHGFEGAPPSLLLPSGPGVWSTDLASRVSAENGIAPAEGSFMLRFDATFWSCPSGGAGSDLWQLVPVSPSATTAHISAKFNRVAGDAQTDTQFTLGVRAHSGSPAGFDDLSPSLPAALATDQQDLFSDGNPATWETVAMDFAIPPGTQYLAVLISAVENVTNDTSCPLGELDGHYADDVSLTVDSAVPALPVMGVPLLALMLAAGAGWMTVRRGRHGSPEASRRVN